MTIFSNSQGRYRISSDRCSQWDQYGQLELWRGDWKSRSFLRFEFKEVCQERARFEHRLGVSCTSFPGTTSGRWPKLDDESGTFRENRTSISGPFSLSSEYCPDCRIPCSWLPDPPFTSNRDCSIIRILTSLPPFSQRGIPVGTVLNPEGPGPTCWSITVLTHDTSTYARGDLVGSFSTKTGFFSEGPCRLLAILSTLVPLGGASASRTGVAA